MAQKLDFNLPFNDLTQYVPKNLRNTVITGLLDNLFNRFMTRDESVPLYGYIGRRLSTEDKSPRIPQASVERDINSVTPVINFKIGTERFCFTVQDIISKAGRVGIETKNQNWLYSQGNNFCPPINFDKFTNFFNYYWVAKALTSTPDMGWNPEKLPEYYVIERPLPSDLTKLNCRTASNPGEQFVTTGSGFLDQTWTISFSSATSFTVSPSASLVGPRGVYSQIAGETLTYQLDVLSIGLENPVDYTQTFSFTVSGPAGTFKLLEFKITRTPTFNEQNEHDGYTEYSSGDVITLQTANLSSNWSVAFSGTAGLRPILGNVKTYNQYQTIGGVQLRAGDRVLLRNTGITPTGATSACAIFVVNASSWTYPEDFNEQSWAIGAETFITEGDNAGKLFRATAAAQPAVWSWGQVGTQSNTNDWQEGNYWLSAAEVETIGIDKTSVFQATRPIIEYSRAVQLNARVSQGLPVDSDKTGITAALPNYKQFKTEFNQVPLFDLFRYDGTHAGLVSPIFYYVEDLTAELDVALQRRVKRDQNESADFVFNHGCISGEGHLLFFRTGRAAGDIKTVWAPGYMEVTIADVTSNVKLICLPGSVAFTGNGSVQIADISADASSPQQAITVSFISPTHFEVSGSISGNIGAGNIGARFVSPLVSFTASDAVALDASSQVTFDLVKPGDMQQVSASETTQQQVWTASYTGNGKFKVSGTKNVYLSEPFSEATVNQPYDNGEVAFTITSSYDFSEGDLFTIRVGNLERPRYVFKDQDENITDLLGGPAADDDGTGAYKVSRTFVNNPYSDSRSEITEGVAYSHFRSIMANQVNGQPTNLAFGGEIKLWGEQHSLLASLLMQRDMTPVSMIDLGKRLYEAAINSIIEIFSQQVIEYFSNTKVASVTGNTSIDTEQDKANVGALLDAILEIRAFDTEVRQVLFDTTSGVAGFPATLPQLGVVNPIEPFRAFDMVLGREVFIHHDGHTSIPYVDSSDFRQTILGNYVSKQIERSDGTSTPAVGSLSATPPPNPYKGELWMPPSGEMLAFDVDFDTISTPQAGESGSRWYNRGTQQLYVSNGLTWILQPDPTVAWKVVNLAETLNELLFQVESRLFNAINPNQRKYDFSQIENNLLYQQQLRNELFTFAAREGLDPLATNYDPQDAFTWNYSQAAVSSFAAISTSSVPARWYNSLIAHHQTISGIIPTERPNLEPWKLLGFSSYSTWWASLSSTERSNFSTGISEDDLSQLQYQGSVRVVSTSPVSTLSGLPVIDGVQLNDGDKVLLVKEASALNNGVWIAHVGGWNRSLDPLANRWFDVLEGSTRTGTKWAVVSAGIANLDPVIIKQQRLWADELWDHITAMRPSLKLSVNPYTDDLLPPYVSVSSVLAEYALTNSLPTGITKPFNFGEGSPVEEIWERSIEYGYAQVKALFRFDPLAFTGFLWGFNWVEADGILYDGFDVSMPGTKRFMLHGEPITTPAVRMFNATSITAPSSGVYTITYDAYDSARRQNFSVRTTDGTPVAFIQEGVTTSVSFSGITLSSAKPLIEDAGVPFKIGDTFILSISSPSSFTYTFEPAQFHRIHGFGQIFTNALRSVTVDTSSSFAVSAFREWDVNMGFRAGGLVVTDDLLVFTQDQTLGRSSFDLIFKKNDGSKDLWLQALRIVLVQKGSTNLVPDGISSLPSNAAEDWVFRIEGYNPNYLDIELYELDGVDGGIEFPVSVSIGYRFFRHDLGKCYTWDGSSWVLYGFNSQTFYALDKSATPLSWYQPLTRISTDTVKLPVTITGLQNVINFIFGYSQLMEDRGWIFDSSANTSFDAATGRRRNWQLDIETLIDRVFSGLELGQGHIINPFFDKITIRQETGLLAPFSDAALFDIYSHAAAFDVLGKKIASSDLVINRANAESSITSLVPVFSMHALIDEYEHLFVFDNFIDQSINSGSLYDAFSGSRVTNYKFNGRRQNTGTMRPEFGGHYLVGSEVRTNLQASTDALSNVYDPDFAFENTSLSKNALALLGFNKKSYFSDLDISDKSQFNFWRGLVQAKGTNMSISAYLNNDRFKDAQIDEYWAYKVAEYGDARQKSFPELKLQVNDCLQQFTLLQFDAPEEVSLDGEMPGKISNFTQISRFDEQRWLSIDDLDKDTYFAAQPVGVFSQSVNAQDIVVLPFIADALEVTGVTFQQLNDTTLKALQSGTLQVVGYGASTAKYSPVKLLNFVDDQLIEEIAFWHPALGQHTAAALDGIDIISNVNPAKYNYSTLVVNNNSFDPLRPWGDNEVGRVWFDTTNLSYIPYFDKVIFPNRAERLSRWGTLADFASIDVYEWVKSSVPPGEYAALAAIDAGNADIGTSEKASGEAALQETYYRDRQWFISPVAWSFSPTPQDIDWGDRPPMKYSGDIIGFASGFKSITTGVSSSRPMTAENGDQFYATDTGTLFVWQAGVPSGSWQVKMLSGALSARPASGNLYFAIDTGELYEFTGAWTLVEGGQLRVNGQLVVLSVGSFSNYGISAGDKIGTWQHGSLPAPLSEGTINDEFQLFLDGVTSGSSFDLLIEVEASAYTENRPYGTLFVTSNDASTVQIRDADGLPTNQWDFNYSITIATDGGVSETILAYVVRVADANTDLVPPTSATISVAAGQQFVYNFPLLGLTVKATYNGTATSIPAKNIALAISEVLDGNVAVKDAVTVDWLIPAPSGQYTNDETDVLFALNQGIGWRAWSVPTQQQLNSDSRQPVSSWKPYIGQPVAFSPSYQQLQEAAAYKDAPLSLNDGTIIERYAPSWGEWNVLRNSRKSVVASSSGQITFSAVELGSTKFDEAKTAVFVNGIAQLKAAFSVDGPTLIVNSVTQGSTVDVIVERYEPSSEELSFNPDVEDDYSFQRQYKKDYQYVRTQQRDRDGNLSSEFYYFWVKNKSTASKNKLSVQAMSKMLKDGPENYLTFQHLLPADAASSLPRRYDAVTISGLSYVVTKDDTFKLRFTRNFTLRDDPDDLDLKNTHTEWSLIRPGQRSKIPEQLWLKLIDSTAGVDAAGNTVPSLRRQLYDERLGTNTRFGFGKEQALAPFNLLRKSLSRTIVNTKLKFELEGGSVGDFIRFIDDEIDLLMIENITDPVIKAEVISLKSSIVERTYFSTPELVRETMTRIWSQASTAQVNELFFAALDDILASNLELTDIFKTSRLSLYSIQEKREGSTLPSYE